MKKLYYLLTLLIMLTSCGSLEKYNAEIAEMHTPAELKEDVDKAYDKLQENHPKLYQYIDKASLDAKFDNLKTSINRPMSSKEFYEVLAPVVKYIGQGHISITPPKPKRNKKERKFYKDKKFAFNTMKFKQVDGKLFLESAKDEDSLLIGSEIISVDNETPQELAKKHNRLIASDGYNKTLFNGFVGSRYKRFYQKEHGFIDSLVINYKNKDSIFTKKYTWIDKKKKDSVDVKEEKSKKEKPKKLSKSELKKKRAKAKKKRKDYKKYGYNFTTKEYTRSLDFKGADSTVAYMKIRGFSYGSPKIFYEDTFKMLDSLGTKELIIDLRDNGGGRLKEIDILYSYLTDTPYVFVAPSEINKRQLALNFLFSETNPVPMKVIGVIAAPYFLIQNIFKTKKKDGKKYWNYKYAKPKDPHPLHFKGAIYVLINGNSFSASSVLSTHLQANKRATFVGEETGGAYNGTVAGLFKGVELPNSKVKLRMGLAQIETPFKQDPDGYGIKADVVLKQTIEDMEKGIDTELQWILNDIDSKRK